MKSKNLVNKLLTGVMILMLFNISVSASVQNTKVFEDYEFQIINNENGEGVEIIKYKGNSPSVMIPEKIENLKVISIGENAFNDHGSPIYNIGIPEGVKTIGANAFKKCPLVNTIALPSSVTKIGKNAFNTFSGSRSVDILINPKTTRHELMKIFTEKDINILNANLQPIKDNELVGTESIISVVYDDEIDVGYYSIIVPGDVNGDGRVTAEDARIVLRQSAELTNLYFNFFNAANVLGKEQNGSELLITAEAARKILRCSADLEEVSIYIFV